MARLIYSATMSADGYISGPGGDMSWLTEYVGADAVADELMTQTAVILAGRRTFTGDDPNAGDPEHEGAFSGMWDGPQFVLTHYPLVVDDPSVTVMDDLPAAVAAASEVAGDGYVNVLGADVARQCLDLGVLDEVLTFVAPVMIGGGTRLLERDGAPVRLERTREVHTGRSVALWYRVAR